MTDSLVQIREVAIVRGGDKGDACHIAIVPESSEAYEAIWMQLTPEVLRASLPGTITGGIDRFQLPNIQGIVLVLHGALGGGPARGWELDRRMPLAVHVGELPVHIPNRDPEGLAVTGSESRNAPSQQ